jgi:hypothetical protein
MSADDDDYDESDTTAEEFDRMWEEGEPVETVVPYDWADDPNMGAEETMRRFNALGPDKTVGPPPVRNWVVTTDAQGLHIEPLVQWTWA